MAADAGYTVDRLAPLGRNRRRLHRRPGGGHPRRADQDRLGQPHRPHREIQPASAHRRRTGHRPRSSRAERRSANNALARQDSRSILTILDGWGYSPGALKATPSPPRASPTTTRCCASFRTRWCTLPDPPSGLPEGQMGNSEVGHLNIGAGRVIHMDVTRIDLHDRVRRVLQRSRRCWQPCSMRARAGCT